MLKNIAYNKNRIYWLVIALIISNFLLMGCDYINSLIFAYSTVYGKVIDEITEAPISSVSVMLEKGTPPENIDTASTDIEGNYSFQNINPDTYNLVVQKDGYIEESFSIVVGKRRKVIVSDFELQSVEQ